MKALHYAGASMLAMAAFTSVARAQSSPALIDFELLPTIPEGPSLFSEAGAAQTIDVPGLATVSGGVVLGNASFVTSTLFTEPNLYGTADFGDDSLDPVLTIAIDPAYVADEVGLLLLNGLASSVEYKVEVFTGATLADTETVTLPSIAQGGSHVFDFEIDGITELKITPASLTTWDYFIDSIALNQTVQSGVENPPGPGPVIPLPPAAWMGILSFGGWALSHHLRRRKSEGEHV